MLRCLKSHKEKLKDCQTLVTARQVEQAEDVSLDTRSRSCARRTARSFAPTPSGRRRPEQCLKDKRQELSTQQARGVPSRG